jgi:hypothetical protein
MIKHTMRPEILKIVSDLGHKRISSFILNELAEDTVLIARNFGDYNPAFPLKEKLICHLKHDASSPILMSKPEYPFVSLAVELYMACVSEYWSDGLYFYTDGIHDSSAYAESIEKMISYKAASMLKDIHEINTCGRFSTHRTFDWLVIEDVSVFPTVLHSLMAVESAVFHELRSKLLGSGN